MHSDVHACTHASSVAALEQPPCGPPAGSITWLHHRRALTLTDAGRAAAAAPGHPFRRGRPLRHGLRLQRADRRAAGACVPAAPCLQLPQLPLLVQACACPGPGQTPSHRPLLPAPTTTQSAAGHLLALAMYLAAEARQAALYAAWLQQQEGQQLAEQQQQQQGKQQEHRARAQKVMRAASFGPLPAPSMLLQDEAGREGVVSTGLPWKSASDLGCGR